MVKVLFGLPLRQTTGMVDRLCCTDWLKDVSPLTGVVAKFTREA
jgi:hypothetical protein